MGVIAEYTVGNETYFKLDTWLKMPDGTLHRFVEKKIPTREHAEMLLSKLKIEAFEGRYFDRAHASKLTLEEAWKLWEPITTRDNDSWQSDVDRAEHICRHLGGRLASHLTQADIDEYRAKRSRELTKRGAAPAPASLDRELALMKKMLNYAVACGRLPKNPIALVPLLRRPNARRVMVREETFQKVLDEASEVARPILVLAYDTGMRQGEIRKLRWEQIDFQARCIRLAAEDTKTDEPRNVYLTARALEAIRQVPRSLHGPFVFMNPKTRRPYWNLLDMFKAACAGAGLEGYWFHDLRRSFVTNARRRKVPESVVMKMSGHKTRSVFDRYNIVDDSDVIEAVGMIERGREEERRGRLDAVR